MDIGARIAGLRLLMEEHQIDAWLITGTDPHLSEYTPDRWKTREWISGFSGSYGKVLVTLERVLLWTDTRYFIQASEELKGFGIELMKDRVSGSISLESWLLSNLKPSNTLGLDGSTISTFEAAQLSSILAAKGIIFRYDIDLVGKIWTDRPDIPSKPAYDYPVEFAGKSRSEKLDLVRNELLSRNLDSIVVSMLDDVAWLLNIRGDEIPYTPLVTAFCYVDLENAWLFINPSKLSGSFVSILEENGIIIRTYDEFEPFLKLLTNKRILVDAIRANYKISKSIIANNEIDSSVSPVTLMKAIKSQEEIINIKNAHIKDGAAITNSLFWLFQSIGKEKITEISVGQKLNEFRRGQQLFKGDSFHPIVGYGQHGAIVHYHATSQTNLDIIPGNILLIDSGGQYLDGTTDLTRTICLGRATENQKEDFTTCLKAHIALATAIFPVGTKGYSLDSIARKPLWDKAINYGHGTGHGIGCFLSVHEGPMSIRAEFNNEPIREGHLLSNEPGIYREGEYGIRIENVILCKKLTSNEFGDFLCFETVSYCPVDRHLIDIDMLNKDELRWINDYHESVYKNISPLLSDGEILEWLKLQCEPLQ
jgi:Xaa-Pro aminopeptidase